ncbi:MAG: hypothetical protein DRI65_18035, partial [Chloroflexota bacterium]
MSAIRQLIDSPILTTIQGLVGGLPISIGDSKLRPSAGWTGTANCAAPSDILVTVNFNKEVTYTGHTGISITHDNAGTFTITGPVGATTNSIAYEGTWDVAPSAGDAVSFSATGSNYTDPDAVSMEDATIGLTNCLGASVLEIESYQVIQVETPNGNTIIRSAVLEVNFNQPVTATDTTGVTATVHGAVQSTVLSGSGTQTLRYTLQRAIFRHDVTWAYDGLGTITAVDGGQGLAVVTEQ